LIPIYQDKDVIARTCILRHILSGGPYSIVIGRKLAEKY
jgi:hypothetical protein